MESGHSADTVWAMSQENVDIIRSAFADYAREGAVPGRGYLHPDVVWNPADEAPQYGEEAVIAYMDRWEGEWEDLTTEVEEFLDAGDSVLVTVHFSGRGRLSGISVDARTYEVYMLRDGKIARMDEFTDRAVALEAAGM